jgi:selT/selW/selH-like putative selenoprotein
LAAEIEQRFPDARVELIASRGGRFEVVADGTPVFEKSKLGRHAQPGEVVASLERLGR